MTDARTKTVSAFKQLPKELQMLALTLLLSACITILYGAAVSYAFLLGVVATRIYMWTQRTESPKTEPT